MLKWIFASVTLLACVMASAQLAPAAWPKFRGNSQNSGLSTGFSASNNVLWSHSFGAGNGLYSSPVVGVDGTIYIGSRSDYHLYALDGATGNVNWSFAATAAVSGSAAVGADGTVYFGSEDSHVYALDGATGSETWSFATGGSITGSPAIGSDGTVYIGSHDGKLYALNGSTGAVNWSFPTGGNIYSSPAIGPDGTVYIGSADQSLYALDPKTGDVKWYFVSGGKILSSPAVGSNGDVYIGSDDGNFYALNAKNGRVEWTFVTGGPVESSAAIESDGTVVVGSTDGKLYALNGNGGGRRWAFDTGDPILSSPAISNAGYIYFGSNNGNIFCLKSSGYGSWKYSTTNIVHSSPAIAADGTMYVASLDGNLYAFQTTYPGPRPLGLTISPREVPAGIAATGTITLDNPALYGGAVVNLSSSESYASVPSSVMVPYGQSSATFPISTTTTSAMARVDISASINGGILKAELIIGAPRLVSITIAPTEVTGGTEAIATVALSGVARAGGVVVNISSTSILAKVPTAVSVAAGQSSATFTVRTSGVTSSQHVTVRASTQTFVETATIAIDPPTIESLNLAPIKVVGGETSVATIKLTGPAPASGLSVALASNQPFAPVPQSVRVPGGKSSVDFKIKTVAVPLTATAVIAAEVNGARQSANLTVDAPVMTSITLTPTSLVGGNLAGGVITLSSVAPASGLTIHLGSSSLSAKIPYDVVVPPGRKSVSFVVRTTFVSSQTLAVITATLGQATMSATVTIN